MPKFAVYCIPQGDDPFYRLGTHVLGYDVRARASVAMPPDIHDSLGHFDEAWVHASRPFGFHMTIGDAIDCAWSTIPLVERELANLLACFDPARPFTLQRPAHTTVGVWGETGRNTLVLLYEPGISLRMLHTLIVARINPLGTGTGYLQRYLMQPEQEIQPYKTQQMRMFHSPTIFENWYPHFTLLNPYTGEDVQHMASSLAHLFEPYSKLTVQTISLLVQGDDETNWHIYREFQR
ncbi:MAG: hypothetical protein NVS2B12_28360 [Ktedonobacteraceae bacterium]